MKKILVTIFGILVVVTVLEMGFYLYLKLSDKDPGVSSGLSTTAPKDLSSSPTTIAERNVARANWDSITKDKLNTTIYEAKLERVDFDPGEGAIRNPLTLVFNSQKRLMIIITPDEWPITKVYEQKGDDLLFYDYKQLKAGDTVEVRVSTKDGASAEITIVKK